MDSKQSKSTVFLITFFLFAFLFFLLKIQAFRSPAYHYQGDYNRDYLIANHIVQYREFPLTGSEGELGPASASPFHYYFLSAFLLIKNNIIFLGFMNVLLQMLTLIVVYLLARSMFSKETALTAFLLFGFSQGVISQSNFIWTPHIMQPFVNLSYLLLFLSYKNKKYWLLLLSIFIFVLSFVFYYSVLAIAPAFFLLVIIILINQRRAYQYYIGAVITLVMSLTVLYLPLLIYLLKPSHVYSPFVYLLLLVDQTDGSFKAAFQELSQNLLLRTKAFLNFFFPNPTGFLSSYSFISIPIFFLISSYYFLFLQYANRRRLYSYIILCCVLSFFIITTLRPNPPIIEYPIRHFTPIFGMFIILLSEFINGIFFGKLIGRAVKIVLVLALIAEVQRVSPSSIRALLSSPTNFQTKVQSYISNLLDFSSIAYIPNPLVESVKNEILIIQKNEHKTKLDFFQFVAYRDGYEDRFVNEVFWTPLEKEFDVKLTKVNDNVYRGYEPITTNEYLFLRCQFNYDEEKECLDPFLNDHPNYSIVKKIFPRYPSVYLTKRKDTSLDFPSLY